MPTYKDHAIRIGRRNALAKRFGSKAQAMTFGRALKKRSPSIRVAYWIEPDPARRPAPATRQVRGNPAPPAHTFNARDVAGARARLVNFRGDDRIRAYKIRAPRMPDALACIGKVTVIQYEAERDGELAEFRHPFRVRSRPSLCVTPDGEMVLVLGGAWTFSADGFIDR